MDDGPKKLNFAWRKYANLSAEVYSLSQMGQMHFGHIG
jgi:hypothetical protein